jgi:hypothetical protein
VATGYGATVLAVEGSPTAGAMPGIQVVPLKPAPLRETMIVHRARHTMDGATANLLQVLRQFRQA